MIDPWLSRGKEEGIAIFGMNDLAMPTRQILSTIRSLEVPAPSTSRIRKDSRAQRAPEEMQALGVIDQVAVRRRHPMLCRDKIPGPN